MTRLSRKVLLIRVFLLVLGLIGLHAGVREYRARVNSRILFAWPTTDAQIINSRTEWSHTSWGTHRFCPRMTYTYEVSGMRYTSTNQLFDFTCHPDGYDFVAEHKTGSLLRIAYSPEDPQVTFIPSNAVAPGFPWVDGIFGTLILALLFLDLLQKWSVRLLIAIHWGERQPEETHVFPDLR